MWKTIAKNYLQKKKPWQNFLQKICKKICAKKSPWKPSNNLLYLELLKAYQTNCLEVFNGFFCVDFLEFFLHQLFRLIFLVQKSVAKFRWKNIAKKYLQKQLQFFLQKSAKRPVQKNCAEIIEKNMCKNYCKKICAKRAFESLQKNVFWVVESLRKYLVELAIMCLLCFIIGSRYC